MSFVKFSPRLPLDEEGEQENTEAHHKHAHGSEKRAEAEAPLEVNTGGYENTVGDERTVYPAEPHRKGEGEPSDRTKQRAVEHPLRHPELTTREQHAAVQEHNERADGWNDTHDEAGEAPEPRATEGYVETTVGGFNVLVDGHGA